MYRFLLLYLGVYGGMCAYTCRRFQLGTGLSWRAWLPGAALFAGLLLAPILAHRLRTGDAPNVTRLVSSVAFIGMAWVFWWTCTFLAADLWNLLARLLPGHAGRGGLSPRTALYAALGATLAGSAWGLVEARLVRVKEIVVLTAKLPRTAPPLRILLVSDLHLGATSSDSTVRRVVQLAREAYPDLLLSAGDLLDSAQPGTVPWLDLFRSLEPPLGKYAVLGNHECYAGAGLALDRLEQAGFRVLRQETATVAPGVRLVGVDDPAVHTFSRLALPTEADVLARSRNAGGFTLLLKHQPRVTVAARNGMDLQLSGHTHAGQIAPFGAIVSLFNPYPCGQLIRLSDSLSLYVSPGTGTWGPPFRVLARPELTLLVLRGR